ncbi:MAG TPA: choice-of-anchor Q domain-containing protein [Polyangia bacterium]
MRIRPSAVMSLGITLGVLAVAAAPACNRANPLYRGLEGGAVTGAGGAPGSAGDQGTAGSGGGTGTAGAAPDSGMPLDADTGRDATLGACQQASDCLTARGTPQCGAWECRSGKCAVLCPACTDNDNDGFGVGMGCAGPDCDDNDPTVGSSATRACYEGKGGTLGIGACRAGSQFCAEGIWSTCGGQVLPAGEACNGVDDDCNGKTDDGLGTISCGLGTCAQTVPACVGGVLGVCKAGTPALVDLCDGKDNDCDGAVDDGCDTACVHVAPSGDDMTGTGTILRPFRSIQAAIDFSAGASTRPKNVCVAGGNTCVDTNIYMANDGNPLTMANGVSLYGNYEALTWSRCPFGTVGLPNLTVTIAARTTAGVTFPTTVTTPTVIDGVRIARFGGGGGGGATVGITVSGAKQVQISNVVIDDAQNAMTSYGVSLSGGAEALITRSGIFGGAGSVASAGVHSVGSKPTIRENCAAIDATTGHCTSACSPTSVGIHGRSPSGAGDDNGATEAVAIDLVDSPGAVIERNAICGTPGATGAGLRVAGAAAGTVVRGNSITAEGGTTLGLGISMLACADAAPWIVDNEVIVGDTVGTATRAAGIYVAGACHPVIDGNSKIAAGGTGTPDAAFGVFCGADANGVSRCSVTGNKLIQGSPTARPGQTIAVACDAGGCARVSGNTIIGQGGATVVGLSLRATGAFVDRNVVTGGCGSKTTTAVLAEDARSRVENNLVHGAACAANGSTPEADGVRVLVALGGNEVDVSSNTIDAGGSGACQGVAAGIGLGAAAGPKSPHGIFRDNILRAGACSLGRIDFIETEATTTPRLFGHNDLDPTGAPTSLYLRPGAANPPTIMTINMLTGASGNISADPAFVGPADFHLSAGSPCVNAGTSVGAPKTDLDGKARDDHPDIGAYER